MDVKFLFDSANDQNESKRRFLLFTSKIPSDVLLALSLTAFFRRDAQRIKNIIGVQVSEKILSKQQNEGCNKEIDHSDFRQLFDSAFQNIVITKICKKTYLSQISKEGNVLKDTINEFFRFIVDRMYKKANEDFTRMGRMKYMSEEIELFKLEKVSMIDKMNKMDIDYQEKVREYEKEKELYNAKIKIAYRSANKRQDRIQLKNKHDALMNLMNSENELDDLENTLEEKRSKYTHTVNANTVEIEQLKKELMRKGLFLKVIHDRFSHDMLTRYKKKKSLRGLIESKKELVELMQEKVKSMDTYREELEDEEKAYLKRAIYDKLDAIRQKIALRTISNFLLPYINMKFGHRKMQKKKPKKK